MSLKKRGPKSCRCAHKKIFLGFRILIGVFSLARSTNDFNGEQLKAVCMEAGMLALQSYAIETCSAHLTTFRACYYMEGVESESESGSRTTRERTVKVRHIPVIRDNVKEVMFYAAIWNDITKQLEELKQRAEELEHRVDEL
ncbi:hypothetical protein Tco_1205234 [Tanacetum coccineum]